MSSKKVNITFPKPSDLRLQVKMYGKWTTATTACNTLGADIQKGYDEAIQKFSTSLLKIVKASIASGTPPRGSGVYWQPLSESTLKRYGDHPIYYLTGLYYKSVGFFRYKSRTLVGLPINKKRSSAGHITLNQLAILLEYGSREVEGSGGTIPPRPLWSAAMSAVGGKVALKKTILTQLRRRLGASFGIRPNQIK